MDECIELAIHKALSSLLCSACFIIRHTCVVFRVGCKSFSVASRLAYFERVEYYRRLSKWNLVSTSHVCQASEGNASGVIACSWRVIRTYELFLKLIPVTIRFRIRI